ncbi:MAG: DUF1684 domain-containing protein, partial [Bdellovibrionia bacterium]
MKILMAIFLIGSAAMAGETKAAVDFAKETNAWRTEQEKKLRGEESWLAVVGLHWLKEGDNSIGASDRATVVLPEGAPLKLGVISFAKGKASIKFDSIDKVTVDGQPASKDRSYELATDKAEKMTEIKAGTVRFFLIDRPNGIGVRVKDPNSHARKTFRGRKWYAPNEKFKIEAKWTELQAPKKIVVPDVLGNDNEEVTPGFATIEIDGKKVDLYPTKEDDKLFFVFKDKTSGNETYGAARFLYASAPQNGKVTLDFNRAVNPPCA